MNAEAKFSIGGQAIFYLPLEPGDTNYKQSLLSL